jgi:hypothetical protein
MLEVLEPYILNSDNVLSVEFQIICLTDTWLKGWRLLGGVFDTATVKFIVPFPYRSSSLIHLQRRHRTKRHESPLLAKEGTFRRRNFADSP